MVDKIKSIIFPDIDAEVMREVDEVSLNLIMKLSRAVFVFEAIALLVYVLTRKEFDSEAIISIGSVIGCLIIYLLGVIASSRMKRRPNLPHSWVEAFNACYYLLLSSWSLQVAYRHYCNKEQLLTFFAVQMMMVCFLPLKPFHSIAFPTIIFVVLYAILYGVDKGAGLNVFNYALIMVLTITGMVARFYSQVKTAEKSVELKRINDELFYNNRHDGLTGLRNRKALEEDVHKIINKPVVAYMIDVNYFKDINDSFGHAAGDKALVETSHLLKSIFSEDRCYRYGGDEFLVLSEDEDSFKNDTVSFCVSEFPGMEVLLSIGKANGEPHNHDELFKLISEADGRLYEIKARTHKRRRTDR